MDCELKGNVEQITRQLAILRQNGININMNDGKFHFQNEKQAISILELFIRDKVPGYEKYLNDFKVYYDKINSYNVEMCENILQVKNDKRSFSIIITDSIEGFNNYELQFDDMDGQLNYLNHSEISFFLANDSELYSCFETFGKDLPLNSLEDLNNKNKCLSFKEDKNGIYMTFTKKESSKNSYDNSLQVGNPFNNDLWLAVDILYNKLESKKNNKRHQ